MVAAAPCAPATLTRPAHSDAGQHEAQPSEGANPHVSWRHMEHPSTVVDWGRPDIDTLAYRRHDEMLQRKRPLPRCRPRRRATLAGRNWSRLAKAANRRNRRNSRRGEMAEWSMAVVLKTTEPETVPGVRIPLSPPAFARPPGELLRQASESSGAKSVSPERAARRRTRLAHARRERARIPFSQSPASCSSPRRALAWR